MSLVSKSREHRGLEELLNSMRDEIKDLRENLDKKGLGKSKKKQKEPERTEMRPDKIHIFPYEEGNEYVYIALIDKGNSQTSPVIRIESHKMLKLAKTILSLNPKQKCRISEYELTEDTALNVDGELILSPS